MITLRPSDHDRLYCYSSACHGRSPLSLIPELKLICPRLQVVDIWELNLITKCFATMNTKEVHAQQYQKQQGNSTDILTRSCKFRTLDPQGSALLIDRQQHFRVARFCSTTVETDTSPVDRFSITPVDRHLSPDIDRHSISDIDRY
ncbi:hypothetical protein F2Q68_00043018 [Brassica cretica]|uniref:Uncharacterized protein n=1 Tax=Brassica cretica TaxID=69181 RepID=A0A8S9LPP7_BRACR|nr:hypothetical protein F2Q68_00043018 [Brassica cretica]